MYNISPPTNAKQRNPSSSRATLLKLKTKDDINYALNFVQPQNSWQADPIIISDLYY